MPNVNRSQPDIAQDIDSVLVDTTVQPNADTSNGMVAQDIVDVASLQLEAAYTLLETNREASSLKNATTTDPDALSQFALNFEVLRSAATAATGTVTFQARTLPSYPISLPINTIIQTPPAQDGTIVTYLTSVNSVFDSTAVFNTLTGFYEVNVAVIAQNTGTANNVGVNTLTIMPNRITGISGVTNKQAVNNATDQDTNDTLATNILAKTAGVNIGTVTGYKNLITDNFGSQISGVDLAGPFDSDNLRVQFGNEVDIPVISVNATSFTTVLTTSGAPITYFTTTRPVLSVSSIVGTTNGLNYTANVNYGFTHDTSGVFGYSSLSFDGLCWFPGQLPGPGLNLSVQGTYDKTVNDIQNFLNDPTRSYVTGDLLVKTAQKVLINMNINVSSLSGYDRTKLTQDIINAITTALAAYTLGQDVLQDDIIEIIDNVSGVAFADVPFGSMYKSTDSSASNNSITIRKQEYARAGTITVTVV